MSKKEISRMDIIRRVLTDKTFTVRQAAQELGLSYRHTLRLVKHYKEDGPPGLISRKRNKPSNRKTPQALRTQVLQLIEDRYHDFSFTLISEMLEENFNIKVSRELIRQWQIQCGKWKPSNRKQARIHQPRDRRPRFGELVQIDGSPHKWFEDRGPACTLIEFIDDATSTVLYMRFVPAETTEAYMAGLKTYLSRYGIPVSLYSDRHSIFRKSKCEELTDNRWSQFERAVLTLGIDMIHANSPEAKGRVERSFLTHQDRLVKMLRLNDISSLDEGNEYLDEVYMKKHNQRFSVEPFDPEDAHTSLDIDSKQIDLILSEHHQRKISKHLTVQFENHVYQLITRGSAYSLRGSSITVIKNIAGTTLLYKGKKMDYQAIHKDQVIRPIEDRKTLHVRINKAVSRKPSKPSPNHPWKHMRI